MYSNSTIKNSVQLQSRLNTKAVDHIFDLPCKKRLFKLGNLNSCSKLRFDIPLYLRKKCILHGLQTSGLSEAEKKWSVVHYGKNGRFKELR